MSNSIDVVIKQKPKQVNKITNLSNGDVIQLYGGSVGLICYGNIIIIINGNGVPSFDVIHETELSGYHKRLGTLTGITVQED